MIDARYLDGSASGIGRYTEHLIRQSLALAPGLELSLITHPRNPVPIDHPQIRQNLTRPGAPNSLTTRFALARSLDLRGVDLFHSPFNILPAGLPVPATMTLHDVMWLLDVGLCTDSTWRKLVTGTFYRQLIPRSVADCARIFTVSHHSKRDIEERFPQTAGRVDVTYNGLDPFFHPLPADQIRSDLARLQALDPARPFALIVGQGSPYKNHAGALAGFVDYLARRPDSDLQLVLVRRFTRGTSARLRDLMARPEVAQRLVILDGGVSGEELRALYGGAAVFLFPSLYEGFGLPALEAMACGTPVVTSDRGAMAEVAGQAARLVDPTRPEEIGQAIVSLTEDQDTIEALRQAGLQRAAEFSWERCAEQALAGWRRALEAGAPQ